MARLTLIEVLSRLAILLMFLPLLGLAPSDHRVRRDLEQARIAQDLDSPMEAASHIAAAARRLPGRADLWEIAGRYALQSGQPHQAVSYYRQAELAAQARPWMGQSGLTPQGGIEYGLAYQQAGDLDAAIQAWQSVAARYGDSAELTRHILEACLAAGDYRAALHHARVLAALRPDDSQVYYLLSLLTVIENAEAALPIFQRAIALDASLEARLYPLQQSIRSARLSGDYAYIQLMAGRALGNLGEWSLAAETLQRLVQAQPDYAEAWAFLAEAYQQLAMQNPDSPPSSNGQQELETALRLKPDSVVVHTLMAVYYARQEDYARALQSIQAAVALQPRNPVLLAEQGNLLAQNGRFEKAFHSYQAAIQQAPEDPTYRRLFIEFVLEYRYQVDLLALPLARQLVNQFPPDPANLDLFARVLIDRNDLATAERYLLRALSLDPQYMPAHLHLGLIYALRNDLAAARREFELATSDPATAAQAHRLIDHYFP